MTLEAPTLPAGLPLLLRAALKRPDRAAPDAASTGASDAASDAPLTFGSRYLLPALGTAALQRYNALLGFPPGALPLTFYYLPVQRTHLATMLAHALPFRLAGMIHTENDILEHAAFDLAAPALLSTSATIEAPAPNGAIYCALHTHAEQHGQRVFACTSRYLARRGQRHPTTPRPAAPPPGPRIDGWPLDARSGRAYAAVSGDWNPIHLSRWSARMLGLPQPIIHGMHSVAKACAALERLADTRVTRISARFLAPIPLGAEPTLHADPAQHTWTILAAGRPCVGGTWHVT